MAKTHRRHNLPPHRLTKPNPRPNVNPNPNSNRCHGLRQQYCHRRRRFFRGTNSLAPAPRPHMFMYMYTETSFLFKKSTSYSHSSTDLQAETLCDVGVGMGQIASSGVNNLAYWGRVPKVSVPLPVNTPKGPALKYNASKTYISFLVGDGDNVAYIKGSRRQWISQRVTMCQNATEAAKHCSYPLLWTMSPHVLHLAPGWAEWCLTLEIPILLTLTQTCNALLATPLKPRHPLQVRPATPTH